MYKSSSPQNSGLRSMEHRIHSGRHNLHILLIMSALRQLEGACTLKNPVGMVRSKKESSALLFKTFVFVVSAPPKGVKGFVLLCCRCPATMVYLSATSVAFFVTFQLDASFKHVSAGIPSGAIRTRSESCDVETLSTTRFVSVKHLHVKCFLSFWYSASRCVVLCLLLCTFRTYLPTGDLIHQSAPQ